MKFPSIMSSLLVLFLVCCSLLPCKAYIQDKAITKCRELYEQLENALVTDENNIFQLKNYFVAYHTEILYITYNIPQITNNLTQITNNGTQSTNNGTQSTNNLTQITNNLTQITNNGTNIDRSINSSELSSFSYQTGHSMFGLFYIIDPQLLNSLMTGLYDSCRVRSVWTIITLNMTNSTLQWDEYTEQDIQDTLDVITTRIKIYAVSHVERFYKTTTNTADIGYIIWSYDKMGKLFNVTVIVIEILVLMFVMCRLIMELTKFSHKIKVNAKSDPEQTHLYLSVFYTSGFVSLLFIVFDFYLKPKIYLIPEYVSRQIGFNESVILFMKWSFEIVIALGGAITGLRLYNIMDPLRLAHHKCLPSVGVGIIFCLNSACIFFLAYLISLNIVPIVLLVLLHPLRILSVTSILVSNFVINLLGHTLFIFPLLTSDKTQTLNRRWWSFQYSFIYLGLTAASFLSVFLGFILTVSEQLSDHPGFTQTLATFSSSICIGFITYVYKVKPFNVVPNAKDSGPDAKQPDNTCNNPADKGLDVEMSSKKAAEATERENAPLLAPVEIEIEQNDT